MEGGGGENVGFRFLEVWMSGWELELYSFGHWAFLSISAPLRKPWLL
jgi:hypothetical protein